MERIAFTLVAAAVFALLTAVYAAGAAVCIASEPYRADNSTDIEWFTRFGASSQSRLRSF